MVVNPEREVLQVYIDGNRYGPAETLEQLRAENFFEIRFLDAREATLLFGTDHSVGAILLITG